MKKLLSILPFIFLLSACDNGNKALNTTWSCNRYGISTLTIKENGNGYIATLTGPSPFTGKPEIEENVTTLNSDGSFTIGKGMKSNTVKYMEDKNNILLTDGIGRTTRCNAMASQ